MTFEDEDDNDGERWIGEKEEWGLIFLFLWGWVRGGRFGRALRVYT